MNKDNELLIYILISGFLFFYLVLPFLNEKKTISEKVLEKLTDINYASATENENMLDKNLKLDLNMCSKQCCKFTQWNTPDDINKGPMSANDLQNFVGSNYSCNFGQGSGCLCVTKDNLNTLTNRGKI